MTPPANITVTDVYLYDCAKEYACADCKARRSCEAANSFAECEIFLKELAELDALTMQYPTEAMKEPVTRAEGEKTRRLTPDQFYREYMNVPPPIPPECKGCVGLEPTPKEDIPPCRACKRGSRYRRQGVQSGT